MLKILLLVLALSCAVHSEKDYTDFVTSVRDTMLDQQLPFYHSAYERLAYITDTYGTRMWGSESLELVIKEVSAMAKAEGFDNVRLEPVKNFTKWVRGEESLVMLAPRPVATRLEVIGLGGSVAGDVQAEAIVIKDWAELEARAKQVKGKIVVFNHPWVNYEVNADYRVNGASKVAKYGGVAMLVRSVASDSIESVHTGYMEYDPNYPRIPCAAIATQDADMFQRMQSRSQRIILQLSLKNEFIPGANSYNVVFEITGSTYPDQIIVAGGHIDSWDTGSQTGANDDGGGFVTVFEAFRLLRKNGFRPKRTLRFVAWSGEESGSEIDGAAQYLERHRDELDKHIAAFESDLGSSKLLGFGHTGAGKEIVQDVLNKYMTILNASQYSPNGYSADVQPLYEAGGVPILNNIVDDSEDHEFYFRYHHSAGDSMSMMNPDDLDSNVAGIASMLFILADLDVSLRTPASAAVHHLQRMTEA